MYTTIIAAAVTLSAVLGGSVAYSLNKSKIKGFLGEFNVNGKLKKLAKKNKGKVIKNLNLIKQDGLSTQIDHVYVNNSGIFVVETKNYSGKLVGSEKDNNWRQYIGKKIYGTHNFARQNQGHVAAISALLGNNTSLPIYSVVCVNARCKTDLELTKTILSTYDSLPNAIKIRSRISLASDEEVNKIYDILNKERVKNRSVDKTHVERLTLQREYDKRARQKGISREELDIETAKNFEKMASYSIDLTKPGKHSFEELVTDANNRSSGKGHQNTKTFNRDFR